MNVINCNLQKSPLRGDLEGLLRCLQLARNGASYTAPNPMVGAVLVCDDVIIGEGYHRRYGCAHAEPNAINSVEDKRLLKKSTLYVNLEPCSHYGKTPPCADLIIASEIPRVVVGTLDPNPKVAGRGIEKLRQAGVEVVCGVLEAECRELNKHFFTFIEKQRPYITLKWAQTRDGFIDAKRDASTALSNRDSTTPPHFDSAQRPLAISNAMTKILAHKLRAEHQAILVGANTVVLDNPKLNVRHWSGRNPIRVAIDRYGVITTDSHLFDGSVQTIIYTGRKPLAYDDDTNRNSNVELFRVAKLKSIIRSLYYNKNISSILVEGGAQLLNSFIEQNLWDEAQVEISPIEIKDGVPAPIIPKIPVEEKEMQGHRIITLKNEHWLIKPKKKLNFEQ